MDLGTALSVAQTLFAALQCSQLKQICSSYGYKSELVSLQETVSTVRAVLRDAETKQTLSNEAQIWIQELTDAVYDADDLIDEFITTEQNQLIEDDTALNKVRFLFNRLNPLVANKMSQKVEEINKKLDAIAKNHSRYGFSVNYQPIRRRREDTCSYVYAGSIIGRENDLENILGMLLDCNIQRSVSFLSIVGIGGLGKTALAQLVYNDERVKTAFPLKLWACVADQDQKQWDIELILGKILASITGQKHGGSTIDWVQSQLREKLASTKYLLVLDDVWTENRSDWLKLADFLQGSQSGSWVVVTTRSEGTGTIVGDGSMYKLEGLSKENSWRLFERTAFGSEDSNPPDDFVEIGQQIVEGCARVPLAIRVVGSLLYGQDKDKWQSFQEIGLANVRGSNGIGSILKLSYHHLESPLKSCFSYCALFPKDFEINKEMLVNLWMAQGYVEPLDKGQRIEDAAQEYISILLRRCFFQDIVQGESGEIISFKLHDLMHDIAQEVAKSEICITNSIIERVDERVRHLSLVRSECVEMSKNDKETSESVEYSFTNTRIRSYVHVGGWYRAAKMEQLALEALLANCTCLRALDLSYQNIRSLPDSIGELLHLRYLDLTGNRDLTVLPESMKKLHNLETLKLSLCDKLKELPQHLNKLLKLRVLEMKDCYSLTHMPHSMSRLTCLQTLTRFVLGEANLQQWHDQLNDLKHLENLTGHLFILIQFPKLATYTKKVGTADGAYVMNKKHLTHIYISFAYRDWEVDGRMEYEESLMEKLQPNSNLKGLELCGYHGAQMPSWTTLLQNLVKLRLENCRKLLCLPFLGELHHLKVLEFVNLPSLEYIFESNSAPAGLSQAKGFFISLERLELLHLPKLKGWWRGVEDDDLFVDRSRGNRRMTPLGLLCLSELKSLIVGRCPELTSFPLCPKVQDISLCDYNESLRIMRISASELTQLFHCLGN